MASYLKFASFLRLKNNFAPKSGQHLLLTSDLQEHLLHRRTNPVLNKLVNVFLKLLVRLFPDHPKSLGRAQRVQWPLRFQSIPLQPV